MQPLRYLAGHPAARLSYGGQCGRAGFESAPDSAEGVLCVRYIQGFIDGAIATDAPVARNAAGDIGEDESFRERVLRTRLGPRLER